MTFNKQRIDAVVVLVAMAFIEKAKADEDCNDHELVIGAILEDMIKAGIITFFEGVAILAEFQDEVLEAMIVIAHETNPSHDCKKCVLFKVCIPDEKNQEEHKAMATLNEKLDDLDKFMDETRRKKLHRHQRILLMD